MEDDVKQLRASGFIVLLLILLTAIMSLGSCSASFKTAFKKSWHEGNKHHYGFYSPHRGGYYGGTYIPYSRYSPKWSYRSYKYNRPR